MSGQLPAARIADPTTHATPTAPGPGAPTVLIEGRPAWRTMLDTHVCPMPSTPPHGPEKIYLGSTTVLINDQMACRMGDILQGMGPPNFVEMGSATVLIGDNGFGMGREEVKQRFAVSAFQLLTKWRRLEMKDRLTAIKSAIDATLPVGMPAMNVRANPFLGRGFLGQFSFKEWAIDLNPEVLSGRMGEARMRQLVNTAYHEARHGEQWWNAAQHRAAKGDSAQRIRTSMKIPERVANAAEDNPAGEGTSEGVMGETVHCSVYGARSGYRGQVLSNPREPSKYAQYRALPEEEDGWRQGDSAEIEFRAYLYNRPKKKNRKR
jgi:uncharacterized Zn-binding protein involved in type VI secretion